MSQFKHIILIALLSQLIACGQKGALQYQIEQPVINLPEKEILSPTEPSIESEKDNIETIE